jgi:L-iditol 2-dehydrogenase
VPEPCASSPRPPVDGAFGRYVTIHQGFAFTLPATVSDEEGALIEPLAVGLWATRRARVVPGDRVLVTGAGPIGLVTAQAALVAGAAEVVVTDVNAARLAAAGPHRRGPARRRVHHERSWTPWRRSTRSSSARAPRGVLGQGLAVVRPRGTVVAVGMAADDEVSLRLSLVQDNELTLTGVFRYAGVYPAAIALVASGRLDLGSMISSRFPLEETATALEAGRLDPTTVKAMVIP